MRDSQCTKNRKLHHFVTPRDSEQKVCNNSDVRLFASRNLHGKNALENATTDVLYPSPETVFESHQPPSRKRGCDEEHIKKTMDLEDPLANELNSFTGCMSALLSL